MACTCGHVIEEHEDEEGICEGDDCDCVEYVAADDEDEDDEDEEEDDDDLEDEQEDDDEFEEDE